MGVASRGPWGEGVGVIREANRVFGGVGKLSPPGTGYILSPLAASNPR